jgi:ABC-type enterobactin transport system permease subunit
MEIEMTKVWSRLLAAAERRSESGDVPGWVLITVMTAGLVGALWAIAGNQLGSMLREALRSVSG